MLSQRVQSYFSKCRPTAVARSFRPSARFSACRSRTAIELWQTCGINYGFMGGGGEEQGGGRLKVGCCWGRMLGLGALTCQVRAQRAHDMTVAHRRKIGGYSRGRAPSPCSSAIIFVWLLMETITVSACHWSRALRGGEAGTHKLIRTSTQN